MADSVRVDVDGAAELVEAARSVAGGLGYALRSAMTDRARMIARAAQGPVPKRSGRAAATIDAQQTSDGAQIVAGGRRAPYFPWLEYGGRVGRNDSVSRPFVRDGRYIGRAIDASIRDLETAAAQAVVDLAQAAGLDVTSGP